MEFCYTFHLYVKFELQQWLRSATWLVNCTGHNKPFNTADSQQQSTADSDTHVYSESTVFLNKSLSPISSTLSSVGTWLLSVNRLLDTGSCAGRLMRLEYVHQKLRFGLATAVGTGLPVSTHIVWKPVTLKWCIPLPLKADSRHNYWQYN